MSEKMTSTAARIVQQAMPTIAMAALSLFIMRCAPEAAQAQQAGGNAAIAAGQQPTAYVVPVRISRSFFEHALTGQVTLESDATAQPRTSSVVWREYPPTEPAPTGDYLADFRDHQGCAEYSQLGAFGLCFKLQGDVSSVALNEQDVTVQGLGQLVDDMLGKECGSGAAQNLKLQTSERGTDHLSMTYTGQKGSCNFSLKAQLAYL